ncbi:hypothetical protein ACFX10_008797 [Malus domestica]
MRERPEIEGQLGDEVRDGSGRDNGDGAFVKSKEEELEIGKPSEEERGRAVEKNGGQIEREVEEEECYG